MSKMKDKVLEDQENPRIWIEYSTSSSGGQREDPSNPYSSRSPTYTTLTVRKLYKTEPEHLFFKDSLEVQDPSLLEKQYAFLVIARYQTGDSFGSSHGNFQFYSVRGTQEEALEDKKVIEAPRGQKEHYRPWDGYFQRLESVEIELMPLMP